MVGVLSQMEGTDHSLVSNAEHSTAASEHSDVSQIEVKSEQPSAEEAEQHKDCSEAETVKSDDSAKLDNVNEEEVKVKELKSILKRRGQYTMRKVKVDFDLIPKRIPFDETKDYTIEIQIVDKEPVKIKSWAAIFAAKKAEAEAEEAAAAEAEAAMKKAEEIQKREALKRASKAKQAKKEVVKKNDKEEQQRLENSETEESVEDTKPEQLDEEQTLRKVEETSSTIDNETQKRELSEISSEEPAQPNSNVERITGISESAEDELKNSIGEEISILSGNGNEAQIHSNDEEKVEQLHVVTDDEFSEQLSEEVKGGGDDFHPLPEDAELEEKSLISTDESKSEVGIDSIDVSEQMSEEVKGVRDEFRYLSALEENSLTSIDDSKSEGATASINVSEQLSEKVKGSGNEFHVLPERGADLEEKSPISTDDSNSERGMGSIDVSEQLNEGVNGGGNEFNPLPVHGAELEGKSLISTDDSKSEGGMGSTDVSEELSEKVNGGKEFHLLSEQGAELGENSLPFTDDSKSESKIRPIKVGLLKKLPEEVLVTAVSLVEDILAETPVILKVISFDEDTETECLSASVDIPELRDLHDEDRTESSIEELPSEYPIDSFSGELQNLSTSDSATDGSQRTEKRRNNTECTTELIEKENETKNAITNTTDEHRAKANNKVVSEKLNESLKKASPEIIKSAVRVLVEIEKVTLAVVKNLEPLVP